MAKEGAQLLNIGWVVAAALWTDHQTGETHWIYHKQTEAAAAQSTALASVEWGGTQLH